MSMTSLERVSRVLKRQPVDRTPVALSPWGETVERWRREGHLAPDEGVAEHFEQDLRYSSGVNCVVDLDFQPEVLEETDETILTRDGNGAMLRRYKQKSATPEHVGFAVHDRASWEELARPRLLEVDRRRLYWENYREARRTAAEQQQFFCWSGVAPFEQIHPLCGHEHMLMGMALDPAWVQDMVMTYAHLTVNHLELLFAEEGTPDGLFFYEDMGFKHRPFMSPAMYEQIIEPGHKLLFDYAHSLNCPVIVHSCGYIEPLIPGLIRAGMDCLQAMEVKAGMDLPTLFKHFGQQISFFGGVDVRCLISNDLEQVKAELEAKVRPVVEGGGGYILHTDHSEPPQIDYETIAYFVTVGRQLGR